jgi:hypothetical protein
MNNNVDGLTFFAVFSLVPSDALALSVAALAVTPAVGDLAFVVSQIAFRPLPSRVTNAGPLGVVAVSAAQDWTFTCTITRATVKQTLEKLGEKRPV